MFADLCSFYPKNGSLPCGNCLIATTKDFSRVMKRDLKKAMAFYDP